MSPQKENSASEGGSVLEALNDSINKEASIKNNGKGVLDLSSFLFYKYFSEKHFTL